jgi:hypothetical protein
MGLGIQTYLYNEIVVYFEASGKSVKEPMAENLYPVLRRATVLYHCTDAVTVITSTFFTHILNIDALDEFLDKLTIIF